MKNLRLILSVMLFYSFFWSSCKKDTNELNSNVPLISNISVYSNGLVILSCSFIYDSNGRLTKETNKTRL